MRFHVNTHAFTSFYFGLTAPIDDGTAVAVYHFNKPLAVIKVLFH